MSNPLGSSVAMFSCEPDAAFLRRMVTASILINVEYLSAESWVEGCHTLQPCVRTASPHTIFFRASAHAPAVCLAKAARTRPTGMAERPARPAGGSCTELVFRRRNRRMGVGRVH